MAYQPDPQHRQGSTGGSLEREFGGGLRDDVFDDVVDTLRRLRGAGAAHEQRPHDAGRDKSDANVSRRDINLKTS